MYVRNLPNSNNGAVCTPALNFRRVMLNRHQPPALEYRNIWLTNQQTNRSSYVFFQHYNEDGYQVQQLPAPHCSGVNGDMIGV